MYSLTSDKSQSWLSWFLRGVLIVGFLILFAKLFELQIIKGQFYRNLSDQNRIRHIPIPAPRGKILARGGEMLAGNLEVKKAVKFRSDGSFDITDDITGELPENIITDYRRVYPLASESAHLTGYLSVVSPEKVGKVDPDCPQKGVMKSGSLIGVSGLEEEYQCRLEGTDGEELIEVDTTGKKVRTLGVREPIPGQDVKTTIDYGLQKETAEDMVKAKSTGQGAALVTNTSGEILSFYSLPSFDPNILVNHSDSQKIASLLSDSSLPFFDRVVGGAFNPGSVFKPVVALAALEEGSINKDFTYTDTGKITVNGFSYTNWYLTEYGGTEGNIDLPRAIARSTDTFFYTIGAMVGPNNIAKWADMFGLNKPTGVDIPGENHGLIPTTDWKKENIKESWYLGDTYHMAIGQGYVTVTPIELNSYISAIAANGKYCTPHFLQDSDKFPCRQIKLSQDDLDYVKKGMVDACTSGGTGYTFFDFGAKHNSQTLACKTGTAETGVNGVPNAWFTLFTPVDNAKIVATVVFEKAGQGSDVAGPVARQIADYYFQSQVSVPSSSN